MNGSTSNEDLDVDPSRPFTSVVTTTGPTAVVHNNAADHEMQSGELDPTAPDLLTTDSIPSDSVPPTDTPDNPIEHRALSERAATNAVCSSMFSYRGYIGVSCININYSLFDLTQTEFSSISDVVASEKSFNLCAIREAKELLVNAAYMYMNTAVGTLSPDTKEILAATFSELHEASLLACSWKK